MRTTRALDVPAGDYRVDLYTHRPSISGRFLEDAWPRTVAAWFRQEHPGRPWPAWLAEELETFFEPEAGARVPPRCPLGLPSDAMPSDY